MSVQEVKEAGAKFVKAMLDFHAAAETLQEGEMATCEFDLEGADVDAETLYEAACVAQNVVEQIITDLVIQATEEQAEQAENN